MERDIKDAVRRKYGQAARRMAKGDMCGCGCGSGSSCCGASESQAETTGASLYEASQTQGLPDETVNGSLGCGNPTALARLIPGETVLDLGSGGGLDVLLAARTVGPRGRVYGVDMTEEMLTVARRNAERAGAANVEFRRGEIEALPLSDASVDVIISNCVINLSPDKDAVLREAFRVLKPGGRFAVSDTVFLGDPGRIPADLRNSMEGWGACVTGALERQDYLDRLTRAGFTAVGCDVTREYDVASLDGWEHWPADVTLTSAFVHARKPDCGDPVLRPAAAEDLPAALRLLTEAALPTDGLSDQFPGQYVVAAVGGRPIAVAGVERYCNAGLLRSAVIDELWRGHRLGTRLVEERLCFARRAGLTDIYLLTTTAAPFFAKIGFSSLARSAAPAELRSAPEFSSICPLSSSFMRLHFD